MFIDNLFTALLTIGIISMLFYGLYQVSKYAFFLNNVLLLVIALLLEYRNDMALVVLNVVCPLLLINTVFYAFLNKTERSKNADHRYQVNFAATKGNFKLDNIKRGASVIGSAGSGKTESVVYGFLKHFQKESFCGTSTTTKILNLQKWHISFLKDLDIINKLKIAATTLEIVLLDHLIITKDGYYSLADNKELQ